MASRPSFRPRPIDSAKPLPIVRSSKDLRHEDDVVVSRALPAVGTGVEAAELEERHLQQALMASVFGDDAPNKADIPVPVVCEVEPPPTAHRTPFERPRDHYIMFDKSDADLEDTMVDYDADYEDEGFVAKYNAVHKKSSTALTIDALERAMDLLEKHQGRSASATDGDLDVVSSKSTPKATSPGSKDGKRDVDSKETADSLLSYGTVRQELAAQLPSCSDVGRREIHAHWIARRLAHGREFHRLYAKPPKVDDPNPAVAFRPRGREDGVGAGRRMNTYENYKRATLLREEFRALEAVMKAVISREEIKAEHLAVSALRMRIQCVVDGGPRLEAMSRAVCAAEREAYAVGSEESRLVVSCRGLGRLVRKTAEKELTRIPFGTERTTKLKKKKKILRVDSPTSVEVTGALNKLEAAGRNVGPGTAIDVSKIKLAENRDLRPPIPPLAGAQAGVDSFGFDDHGNRFLKHMRYFAGGFMNYGVCPYDHRVFAAASERNTVKEHPNEPKPFMFPNPAVKFAVNGGTTGGKVRSGGKNGAPQSRRYDRTRSSAPWRGDSLGGQVGTSGIAKRPQHPVKVRARVGRGGRIVFDRVVFEPERGVKAASYPASVEMGGVYSAGLPLEAAPKVLAEGYHTGALGSIDRLGQRVAGSTREQRLFQELQPMLTVAEGREDADGRTVYWPSRRQARLRREQMDIDSVASTQHVQSDTPAARRRSSEANNSDRPRRNGTVYTQQGEPVYRVPCTEDSLRNLPAYARRDTPLVKIIDIA
jgi:hypothetical protein